MVNFHSGGNSSVVSHSFLLVLFNIFVDGLNTKRKELMKLLVILKYARQ